MPQQQHTPSEITVFSEGAIYTISAQFAGLVTKRGYFDATNMRLRSMNKTDFDATKILGEELLYPAIQNGYNGNNSPLVPTYKCMYACNVVGKIFEVWCDRMQSLPPFFRINGVIVAQSDKIPFSVDYPIQGDKNDTQLGGEVFLTDFNSTPQIYNIRDLMESMGLSFESGLPTTPETAKYFTLYNPNEYYINLITSSDHPVFIKIVDTSDVLPANGASLSTAGNGGLKVGSYQYSIRYRNVTGDATNWSEPTPLIDFPYRASLNIESGIFPFVHNYGAAPLTGTPNGIYIKFRINNFNNYEQIEIRRTKFNIGSPIGGQGEEEMIYAFNIVPQETSVKAIFDFGVDGTEITLEESAVQLSVIDKAKTPRYFDKRLYLGNIIYASRDVDEVEIEPNLSISPDKMYPLMYNMGKSGHKDPYHSAYYKTLMHGEHYGWGVKVIDSYSGKSFTKPVDGTYSLSDPSNGGYGGDYGNFRMPNRRHESLPYMGINNDTVNGVALVTAANVANAATTTFENFDMINAAEKQSSGAFKNIINTGTKNNINASTVGYQPYHPVKQTDSNLTGFNYKTNTSVYPTSDHSFFDTYTPKGFGPNYHSLGMAVGKVTNLPAWASAFCVQRTAPASRVVCQGIGFYSLNPATADNTFPEIMTARGTKELNKFWFYSPDVESGVVSFQDVLDNPDSYEVEFISPVGFFSEVFNFAASIAPGRDYTIDMIAYSKILFENNLFNPGDVAADIGNGNGYVNFGQNRNANIAAFWQSLQSGNTEGVGMNRTGLAGSPTLITQLSGREQAAYELLLDDNIYASGNANNQPEFSSQGLKDFTEPMYIINIVRKNVNIDVNSNQQTYYNTGHYQKLLSFVGKSTGFDNQQFELVDERWEDCITKNSVDNKFIYVRDIGGNETKWINITNKTAPDFAAINAAIHAGVPYLTYGILSGMYTHSIVQVNNQDRFYTLVFKLPPTAPTSDYQYYIPAQGKYIAVKYDDNFPISVFGGESVVGDATWAPIDGKIENGGEGGTGSEIGSFTAHPNSFPLAIGFPFYTYEVNPLVFLIRNTTALFNKIQNSNDVTLFFIRQMVNMFVCTSRTHVPYAYNVLNSNFLQSFPLVNYVSRANEWNTGNDLSGNNIFSDYGNDYPEELNGSGVPEGWVYGGFRFKQTLENINIDYSKQQENYTNQSKPLVGFKEKNWFPTRAIWSDKREINEQNSTGLKTFGSLNFIDINDNSGEIKLMYSSLSPESGDNLYAFTDHGICLLMTNKYMVQQAAGTDIEMVKAEGDQSIVQERWLTISQGLSDEYWRTFASHNNVAWMANNQSVWRFENNKLEDIGSQFYHKKIKQFVLDLMKKGYASDVTGLFNEYHSEYWLSFKQRLFGAQATGSFPKTFTIPGPFNTDGCFWEVYAPTQIVKCPLPESQILSFYVWNNTAAAIDVKENFGIPLLATVLPGDITFFSRADYNSLFNIVIPLGDFNRSLLERSVLVWQEDDNQANGKWIGGFEYDFDKFVSIENNHYAMRNGETYQLDKGNIINGEDIVCSIIAFSTGGEANQIQAKEFWYIGVASKDKPTKVLFYETVEQVVADTPVCFVDLSTDSLYLKNFSGYQNYIPRKDAAPYNRVQGLIMFFKVEYSGSSQVYSITDVRTFTKNLK